MTEPASDDVTDPSQPGREPGARSRSDAAILPFPSNRPLDPSTTATGQPRLRELVGDVLREERHRQGRTLADVADAAAVSLPYLSEVERGRKEVSSDVLESIGAALELPLVEILERSAGRLRADACIPEASGRFGMQRATHVRMAA